MGARELRSLALDQNYSTGSRDLITEFYMPCLGAAGRYDRAAGFFRSSLFALIGVAMSDFALRGGVFRLICSPCLDGDDIEAIRQGMEKRKAVERRVDYEIQRVLEYPENVPVVVFLATLIAAGAMDIRLACRPEHAGIFHTKLGVFHDDSHAVSFIGSSNETFSAWDMRGNHEAFEVFTSWGTEGHRVRRHIQYFERLWNGKEEGVKTYELPDLPKSRLLEMADRRGVESSAESVRDSYHSLHPGVSPRLVPTPGRRTLFPHQTAAVENWISRGYRGIVPHATGAGKTVTALEAVRRWISDGRPALIIVPSQILADQWREEVARELGADLAVLGAGGGSGRVKWESAVADHTRNLPDLGPRVLIATMQTASTASFLRRVQSGQHLLVVADEVHRIGSSQHRRLMGIEAGGRLGLSATPQRFGDPEGTRLILEYFGQPLEPPFGLAEAIAAGRLVPYDYHVHQVPLLPEEQDAWDEATEEIKRAYARLPAGPDGKKLQTEGFKLALIRRARIVKKAAGKAILAGELVVREIRNRDRWLVYCDDQAQLRDVLQTLRQEGLSPMEYHSAMLGAREETLKYFLQRGGILVAIRCLDEGVDIPLVNKALILASSSNPREFIQRRGRVLRVAPGKHSATVHDALVIPSGEFTANDPRAAIVRTELRRAMQFAQSARNDAVRHELEMIARRAGLEPLEGIEFDFEDSEEEVDNGKP
ncbi:MAG TPA: DEAD/DEAH box helicase family protein [Anaerolineae bacterium]|nr:DEAD/DEAH box helicase family protein [Anaerolineae bacterium]